MKLSDCARSTLEITQSLRPRQPLGSRSPLYSMISAYLTLWYSASIPFMCNSTYAVLPLSYRSTILATLQDQLILKLLQLFHYGNFPRYQNCCKSRTTMTDGLRPEGLKKTNRCFVMYSYEKRADIRWV